MLVENGYLPLPEANTTRVRTTLRLPYRLENEVGLRCKSIEFLCQLAGVTTASIHNEYLQSKPEIALDSDDDPFLIKRIPIARIKNTLINPTVWPPNSRWSKLEIFISETEATLRLENQGRNLNDPRTWAKIINDSIKDGLALASRENLLKKPLGINLFNSLSVFLLVKNILERQYPHAALLFLALQSLDKVSSLEGGWEKAGEGARWSLSFLGLPELDRMTLLGLIMPFPKLAKKINK